MNSGGPCIGCGPCGMLGPWSPPNNFGDFPTIGPARYVIGVSVVSIAVEAASWNNSRAKSPIRPIHCPG
jgi:hypothetical protein